MMKQILKKYWFLIIITIIICLAGGTEWCGGLYASEGMTGETHQLGHLLPWWSVIPFVGILLSIAIFPLWNVHWWEHNMAKVSAFWAFAFIIPFWFAFGTKLAVYEVLHILIADYIPFIILLGALFIISGGIIMRGTLRGTPVINTIMLLIGTVLSSWIGTTGSSMLLIRPVIRANAERKKKAHTIIFFIFLVSNIGGSLTPVGDPPLFLGFLHGVPFFWTLKLLPLMLVNVFILTVLYLIIDTYFYHKENLDYDAEEKEPIRVEGLYNLIFLIGVVGSIIMSGILSKNPAFINIDPVTGLATPKGIQVMTLKGHEPLIIPLVNLLRDGIIILMALLSLKFTDKKLREDNFFTWGPIKEVGVLFAGIFMTIIPAMAILKACGGQLGVTSAAQFFWATGALSSFLDNAPTYLTFLSLAGGLNITTGITTDLGIIAEPVLLAISCGAVFMGANTYIGNAPNFMVRSIAEENGIKMPSFFGYMGWSVLILIPLFLLNTLLFF